MSDRPTVRTRVAQFDYDDNRFCGYSIRDELAGKSGYWTTISLALGGPRLTPDQERVLDGLATAAVNADPRVWPLKVTRLLASYGSSAMGIGGSFIALGGGFVGAPAIEGAARLLTQLAEVERTGGRTAVEREVLDRIARGQRLMGFGVPSRERDERVVAAAGLIEQFQLDQGRHWQLMLVIEGVAVTQKETLRLNIGAASSAIFLDLGFTVTQIGTLAALMLLNNMVANATEGAEQKSPLLQEFPRDYVRYEGPPDRSSPRALARRSR